MSDDSAAPAELINKSVVKAARLLRELAAQPGGGATATTLAKAVGMSRPTTFRLLLSLEHAGLVDRIDNNYVLGWELARLGRYADPHSGVAQRAQPLLQELADELNESATLSVPTPNNGLELIAEAYGSHVVGVMNQDMRGQHYPLHASSTGKVFLAELGRERVTALLPEKLEAFTGQTITDRTDLLRELDQVREQGYGIIDNELEEGLLSLSRPVRDPAGELIAILTVNGPRYRLTREQIPGTLELMRHMVERFAGVLWEQTD
ncbi:IclR family transcriptional regulator [Streptomyces cavernicola]|uniref:IclR family transcriptional regulator n=1 Tax=Streptomyces cavernicola TaxID=3043613 RepID=A0ABT6SDZ6_9ACTN|nr:IclR family transcriptional regulator [Streptomyces sp. B-S-A6]MDI3406422.1 IclR family transcriptional regulator [Streptomyces sp. B-S-A6]